MEVINMDKDTFESIIAGFSNFKRKVLALCNQHKVIQMDEWLDNQEVCMLLNISPRTLQTLRTTKQIGFSRINSKMYYRASDIQKLITTLKK